MLKTLERIKKIKELEKLIELQKLENLKYEKAALETEEKTVFQEMEKLSKNISFTTFFEISIQRKKLREIEKSKKIVLRNMMLIFFIKVIDFFS